MTRKITLFRSTILLSLTLGSAAWAGPVLKSDIVVTGPVVTAGDLFEDAGSLAPAPMFRAPPLGTNGNVTLPEIRTAAGRIGLLHYEVGTLENVRVSHPGTPVDEAMLSGLITGELAATEPLAAGMTTSVRFDATPPALVAESTGTPVRLANFRHDQSNGAFTASFEIAGRKSPLQLTGKVDLLVAVPHLAQSLPAGAVIGPTDIEMRQVPVRFADSSGVLRLEDTVGKQLQRASRAGLMLKSSDIAEPLAVQRNDQVTLYYRQGPMTLTVKGQALNAAAPGAPVNVLNSMSNRVVTGVATGPGAVEVRSSASITVAGLQ